MDGKLLRDFGHEITVQEITPAPQPGKIARPSTEYRVYQGHFPLRVFYSLDEAIDHADHLAKKIKRQSPTVGTP